MLRRTLKSERYKENYKRICTTCANKANIQRRRKMQKSDRMRERKKPKRASNNWEKRKRKTKRHTTPKTKTSPLTHISNTLPHFWISWISKILNLVSGRGNLILLKNRDNSIKKEQRHSPEPPPPHPHLLYPHPHSSRMQRRSKATLPRPERVV